jgi:outer membrane protein OmpA-like peptidoglycan-associated protein
VKYGIDSLKIETEGVREGFEYDANGNYLGGVSLLILTTLEERETEIINRILYSPFGSKTFEADSTLLAYGLELKHYMTKYPTKTVQIIGHTDGIGTARSNYLFGEERAKQVKSYLVSIGIAEDKLLASSKGESEPIGDNKTPEGRAKNRRTAIIVN